MSNTHRAVIESSVPPRLTPIAAGPEDFCREYLDKHVANHPLGEFETALVLAVEEKPGMKNKEAVRVIALTLAELGNHKTPTITEWGQAKVLADKFEAAGHIQPEPKPAPAAEEPSYMMFARANARGGFTTGPTIVEALLQRIDRLEGK